jgi:hypothetical protein
MVQDSDARKIVKKKLGSKMKTTPETPFNEFER